MKPFIATNLKTSIMKITKKELKQIKDVLDIENGHSANHIRVEITKNIIPHLFKTELVVGKWYKEIGSERMVNICASSPIVQGYGFGVGGWVSSKLMKYGSTKNWILATDKEVQTALIKEAKKRGFKEGVIIKHINSSSISELKINNLFLDKQDCLRIGENGGYAPVVFDKGKWATIIETITQEQAEKELGKTII